MTYITKYVTELEALKKELETNPNNIRYYIKYMGFIGDSNSIEYLENKIKEYYESKND
jgi:hypothetical protein|tara:strand:+ start:2314 stop:2487 length:174 start_codon:yes stop_codon:yes gene_type:complete